MRQSKEEMKDQMAYTEENVKAWKLGGIKRVYDENDVLIWEEN